MIGTTGATVLFLINVLFASLLGIGAGGLACLVLRRPWGIKVALIDAVLAAVVAVVAAYVVAAIENARGIWESRVTLILVIAVASVVVRHLIRLALRSSN
jgi:phage baseplate assembly protein W